MRFLVCAEPVCGWKTCLTDLLTHCSCPCKLLRIRLDDLNERIIFAYWKVWFVSNIKRSLKCCPGPRVFLCCAFSRAQCWNPGRQSRNQTHWSRLYVFCLSFSFQQQVPVEAFCAYCNYPKATHAYTHHFVRHRYAAGFKLRQCNNIKFQVLLRVFGKQAACFTSKLIL